MARDKDDIDFLKHQIELLKELVRELQKENEVLKNGQYLRNPARHRDTRRQSLSVHGPAKGLIILLIIIGLFGCQKYEYTAYDKKSGVELSNVYQSESDWSANDMGYAYKGTGSISNSNNYDIHIKQTRIYYRNNMLIDTFVIKAKGCKVFYFTGGDIFEMTDRDGTPMGVLHATPKKGNKASRQTRE